MSLYRSSVIREPAEWHESNRSISVEKYDNRSNNFFFFYTHVNMLRKWITTTRVIPSHTSISQLFPYMLLSYPYLCTSIYSIYIHSPVSLLPRHPAEKFKLFRFFQQFSCFSNSPKNFSIYYVFY